MLNYNKAIAAFLSVLLARLILKWTGVDISALGVGSEWQGLIQMGIDLSVAAFTTFWVWLIPNIKRIHL